MATFFYELHPVWQAFLATLFTWGLTALGASVVFFTPSVNRKLLASMLGFAAGVMIAASFWSLLAPAMCRRGVRSQEPGVVPHGAGNGISEIRTGGCRYTRMSHQKHDICH